MSKIICVDGSVAGGDECVDFVYTNSENDIEKVRFEQEYPKRVELLGVGDDSLSVIYVEDIPHLIFALQAAYDYINKEK